MKTVGEFKKAGLEFVKGDHVIERDGSSSKDDIDFNYDRNFNKYNHFDSSQILEFAWRENTWVKPEFSGLIEFTFNGEGCEIQEVRLAENVNWEIVKKWRPSLNQPQQWPDNSRIDAIGQNGNDGLHYDNTAQQVEVIVNNNTPFSIELAEKGGFSYEFNAKELDDKPIFTQVMADDGEFPPVGAKAKVCIEKAGFDIDNSDLKFEGKVVIIRAAFANEEGEKIVAIENEDGNCACFIIECIEPLDTRTDREKAIDDMFHVAYPEKEPSCLLCRALEKLYDAGYRKC